MWKSDQTTSTARLERVRSIIGRFPESEDAIRELMRTDSRFDALCEEYAKLGEKIDELAQLKRSRAMIQASELQKCRVALEEELLTTIEGYQPV
jgi:uncharacterized protein YdcH (DUF465 family)